MWTKELPENVVKAAAGGGEAVDESEDKRKSTKEKKKSTKRKSTKEQQVDLEVELTLGIILDPDQPVVPVIKEFATDEFEDAWSHLKVYEGDIITGLASADTPEMVNTKRLDAKQCTDLLKKLVQEKR